VTTQVAHRGNVAGVVIRDEVKGKDTGTGSEVLEGGLGLAETPDQRSELVLPLVHGEFKPALSNGKAALGFEGHKGGKGRGIRGIDLVEDVLRVMVGDESERGGRALPLESLFV